ncbi:PepSY domain-containing protein [Pseudoalteromonas phenolica]|uniref:PepSY domain-containing protein n=1 Tax=Pseudoalteromonas phenolica TaxID=161398 RepID=UPI001F4F2CA1|nr:PepSY domain-containing protein [Pseudoalteromonas phenolica]
MERKKLFPEQQKSEYQYNVKELPKLNEITEKIEAYAPGYQIERITLSRLNTTRPSASVNITHPREMMRGPTTDFIFMHPYTLEINASSIQGGDQGVWVSIVSSMFALHFGSYGGTLGQWAYFVMGLLGALLFYTGNLLWIEKRRRQKQATQSKSNLVLAKLTVGIALGCICAISLAFATTKWISLTSLNVNIAYLWLYYLTFFAVVIAAFIKGPSITAIYTLKISAILCLIVPLNSLIALLLPSLGLWYADSFGEIMLEVMTLPFAWFFYVCASKVTKRAYNGEKK